MPCSNPGHLTLYTSLQYLTCPILRTQLLPPASIRPDCIFIMANSLGFPARLLRYALTLWHMDSSSSLISYALLPVQTQPNGKSILVESSDGGEVVILINEVFPCRPSGFSQCSLHLLLACQGGWSLHRGHRESHRWKNDRYGFMLRHGWQARYAKLSVVSCDLNAVITSRYEADQWYHWSYPRPKILPPLLLWVALKDYSQSVF